MSKNSKEKDILTSLLEDIMTNRIMIMRLANAIGMYPDTLNQFQDECIKEAKKEIKKKIKEEKEKEQKKNENNK